MREPNLVLASALERDRGLAIVWCPDLALREWLVAEVESLAPEGARTIRVRTVEEALCAPKCLVLLVPDDEVEVVRELDGSRDQALDPERSWPVVLFLLRDGDGARTLAAEAPSAWSWAGGSDVDPERLAEVDVAGEREQFHETTGETPEAWLERWRSDGVPRNRETFSLAYRAMLLEDRSS